MQSVQMMYKLVNEAEGWLRKQRTQDHMVNGTLTVHKPIVPVLTPNDHLVGMASAVVKASRSLHATCIIVLSKTGNTAINVAKFRPDIPIVCLIPNHKVGRFLQIHRGIHPVVPPRDLSETNDPERFEVAIDSAKKLGFCKDHDTVIIVCYESPKNVLSSAVSMRVAQVVPKP